MPLTPKSPARDTARGKSARNRTKDNCSACREKRLKCDKEGDRTTCKRCEEKGIKCEVAPKKVRHRSSDLQPSSSRSVSAGISCNENMSPPLYLPMPLTEEPASQYDPKIHKSSYSELSGALGQCSVPTNKPERDASALPAIPWDRIVDWAHRAPEITSLDDQMLQMSLLDENFGVIS